MKFKPTIPLPPEVARPYVMGIADTLSDDPLLSRMFASRFKVIVDYDGAANRLTYSFRSLDDSDPDEADAQKV